MNKHMVALVASGALAGQDASTEKPTSTATPSPGEMASMMSDPQFRDQMKNCMSQMMGDEEMREMASMMSDPMSGVGGMESGDMGGMGSGATQTQPQDDSTP